MWTTFIINMALTDNSPMPQNGKYKGVAMANVPAWHLLWLYENNKCTPDVKAYIEENIEVLQAENKGK